MKRRCSFTNDVKTKNVASCPSPLIKIDAGGVTPSVFYFFDALPLDVQRQIWLCLSTIELVCNARVVSRTWRAEVPWALCSVQIPPQIPPLGYHGPNLLERNWMLQETWPLAIDTLHSEMFFNTECLKLCNWNADYLVAPNFDINDSATTYALNNTLPACLTKVFETPNVLPRLQTLIIYECGLNSDLHEFATIHAMNTMLSVNFVRTIAQHQAQRRCLARSEYDFSATLTLQTLPATLTVLKLYRCDFVAWNAITQLSQLRSLDLCEVKKAPLELEQSLPVLPTTLQTLKLDGQLPWTDSALKDLPELTQLNLINTCHISGSCLASMPKLRHLHLHWTGICGHAPWDFSAWAPAQQLQLQRFTIQHWKPTLLLPLPWGQVMCPKPGMLKVIFDLRDQSINSPVSN